MEIAKDQPGVPANEVLERILGGHLERLIGTRYGIAGIPLSLSVIACLALLADRESERSDKAELSSYTRDTLIESLGELGFVSTGDSEASIKLMIDKGYMAAEDGGFLSVKQPAMIMIKLFDHLFSGMNAMGLVVYYAQIVDEVVSGRKEIASAANQFHQILQMKGIVLKSKIEKKSPDRKPQEDKNVGSLAPKMERPFVPRKAQGPGSKPPEEPKRPVREDMKGFGFKELTREKEKKLEGEARQTPATDFKERLPDPEPVILPERRRTERLDYPSAPVPDPEGAVTALKPSSGPSTNEFLGRDAGRSSPKENTKPVSLERNEPDLDESGTEISDDYVERRIAQFTEDLMVCPLCSEGKVQVKQTLKKKYFYVCSNKKCTFISWGKPFYLACPLCKNPFLIESSDSQGKTYLKCPRATCLHKQGVPGMNDGMDRNGVSETSGSQEKPRKKILVRKRVVRKKR